MLRVLAYLEQPQCAVRRRVDAINTRMEPSTIHWGLGSMENLLLWIEPAPSQGPSSSLSCRWCSRRSLESQLLLPTSRMRCERKAGRGRRRSGDRSSGDSGERRRRGPGGARTPRRSRQRRRRSQPRGRLVTAAAAPARHGLAADGGCCARRSAAASFMQRGGTGLPPRDPDREWTDDGGRHETTTVSGMEEQTAARGA